MVVRASQKCLASILAPRRPLELSLVSPRPDAPRLAKGRTKVMPTDLVVRALQVAAVGGLAIGDELGSANAPMPDDGS